MDITRVATARLLKEIETRKSYKREYLDDGVEEEIREELQNKAAEAASDLEFDVFLYAFKAKHLGNGTWKVSIIRGKKILVSWELVVDHSYDFKDRRFDSVYEKSKEFFKELREDTINKAMRSIGSSEEWLDS